MKTIVCVCLFALVAVALARPDENAKETYTTKFDGVDLNEIKTNERLMNTYTNCLVGKGQCTPDGKELKANLPDALQNSCSKCSPKQKEGAEFMIRFIVKNRPDIWKLLTDEFDPTGEYTKKYEDELKKVSE